MKRRSNLDEMQEMELLKIEHNGCWLAFWLLLASMIIETILYGSMDFRTLAGEWIIFMILSVYLAVACVRKGIWDRKIPMTAKSNLIASLIAALVVGAFNAFVILRKYQKPLGTLAATAITMIITFTVTFALLTFMMKQTEKRSEAIEAEPEDADRL